MFICESDRSTSCFRKLERIAIRLSNAFQVLIKQLFPVINGLTRKDQTIVVNCMAYQFLKLPATASSSQKCKFHTIKIRNWPLSS